MIPEFLINIGMGLAAFVVALFPPIPFDSLMSASSALNGLGQHVASLSAWVNWLALAGQITIVMGLYFTFLAVRILRALLGHVPFFGGNG